MLFEKFVPYNTDQSIATSEAFAAAEVTPSSTTLAAYLLALRQLMAVMRTHHTTPLTGIPVFTWHGVTSTCWCFEEFRCLHTLHRCLLQDAKLLFQEHRYKEAKVLLDKALLLCKNMLTTQWYQTPYVRCMPFFQKTYLCSVLLATKGLALYNMHCFKSTPTAVKKAYQCTELAHRLWKPTQNLSFEYKLLAQYHHAIAAHSVDPQVKLSHSTCATQLVQQHDISMLTHVQELFTDITRINNSVHYFHAKPVKCDYLDIDAALKLCA
jgi:hypothetical protein